MLVILTGNNPVSIIGSSGEYFSEVRGLKKFNKRQIKANNPIKDNNAMLRAVNDGSPEAQRAMASLDKNEASDSGKGSKLFSFLNKAQDTLGNGKLKSFLSKERTVAEAPPDDAKPKDSKMSKGMKIGLIAGGSIILLIVVVVIVKSRS